MDKGS